MIGRPKRMGLGRVRGTLAFAGVSLFSLLVLACHRDSDTPPPLDDGCRSCHGGRANAAPPKALDGSEAPSSPGVGAHQTHVLGGALQRPVGCEECHIVPNKPDDPGHTDTPSPAELTWGRVATSSGAQPIWDRSALTCSNSYCHGATLSGGTNTAPKWNVVDGSQAACGTCHGLPPPMPHPSSDACEQCHGPVAGPNLTLARPVRHADGILDVVGGQGCATCHGSNANAAPPKALNGATDTKTISVGAHQSHLAGGVSSKAVECAQCHLVPARLESPGHTDTSSPAELTFGSIAGADSSTPTWNRATATCTNTYCHGSTLEGGGTNSAPTWNQVDGTQAACGSCHGLPPPAPHPADERCELCHLPTAGPKQTIANRATHVDGRLHLAVDGCTGCHGSTESIAPPVDNAMQSDTSLKSVGAHQTHLAGGRGSLPVACSTCHLVPEALDAPGHRDTPAPAELRFEGIAIARGAQPVWDDATATCRNTYCHGSTLGGGMITAPTWTTVDGTQADCGSCHGTPPPGPHPQNERCEQCHSPTAGPNKTIANPATHINGTVESQTDDCTACHGSDGNAAPPFDTTGSSDARRASIGAHRMHLEARNGVSRPVACTECHLVPDERQSPGHTDTPLPVELTWGALATTGGSAPSYDPVTHRCTNTYCHGSKMPDGSNTTPDWTLTDGTQTRCGTCHGAPPGGTHPQDDRCETCHLPTAGLGQTIADPTTHINGVVEVQVGCDSCHGSNGISAPPVDLDAQSATTLPTVGAHRAHLSGGAASRALSCTECHFVPATENSPGHRDTPRPAELNFGSIARQGHSPRWVTPTCNNTYCHAGNGAQAPNPSWVVVDGTQATCEGCHGMPPPTPVHSRQTECTGCHLPTAGAGRTVANRATHVDGIVQITDTSCGSCHGSPTNAAPPRDLVGETATDVVTVGAHQTHLSGGITASPVACEQCHLVPTAVDSAGHTDTPAPAELTFGTLARADGAAPSWDRAQASCANVYCHGTTLANGGASAAPRWTVVDGTQAACGSCHGVPPPAPHPAGSQCELCHLPTAGSNQTIADRTTHVDGTLQVALDGCTGCHGTAVNLAPPVDAMNRSDTTLRSVGAHQSHLAGGRLSQPVACTTCHVVPATVDAPGHRDSALPAELTFSGLATSGGAQPQWNAQPATCTNTYCHGGTLTGGAHTAPVWTTVNGTEASCGSCHGMPPPAPHPPNAACENCHSPTAGPNQTIASVTTHVDGLLQVSTGDCTSCHGSNGNSAPPLDTRGGSDLTLPTVGAHRSHLAAGSGLSRPIACQECHVVPADSNSPGHRDTPAPAELTWGPLSSANGAAPTFDRATVTCSGNYCHGATLPDGVITTPIWNKLDGTQSACGACHGVPPAGTHPRDDRCELCHLPTAGSAQTIADATTHIDGRLQVQVDCDSCHGSGGVAAPPTDLDGQSLKTLVTVGAHREHLAGGAGSRAVACTECHVVPQIADSPGHRDTARPAELAFGRLAAQGHAPRWTSPTCANTYCHSGNGGSITSPRWNVVDGTQGACGSCHGIPPPTPVHTAQTSCEACHLPTAGPGRTIANRATHVDGILQVTALDCGSCHGDMTTPAPPRDLDNDTAATDPQVGTHRTHLSGGSVSAPIPCGSCHLVPVRTEDPGHVDTNRPAEVIFSGLASASLTAPVYDPVTHTCSDSYCHGALSSNGTNMTPSWNQPGTAACGSCHGLPPSAPHPQSDGCEACHPQTAGPNRTIIDRNRHIDGQVQTNDRIPCQTCHGTAQSPAPPPDLNGRQASATVGAHRAHLAGTGRSKPTDCSECHVPVNAATPGQAGHYDSPLPAEVTFGVLARRGGLRPDFATATCRNTYCHGASLPGGVATAPTWGGGPLACNACHGMPPPDTNHGGGTATQCEGCHPDTAGPSQTIVNPARHVDGVVDTSASCDACHGSSGDPTPPRDLAGLTTGAKVGAHTAHRLSTIAAAVECTTCHNLPSNYADAGHADTPAPAEVILRNRAALDGATPSYAAANLRCSNTYCHGVTLAGGATAVTWGDTTGTQDDCGACHGMPPATPAHNGQGPNSCQSCHTDSAGPNQTIIAPALHVDGTLQVSGGGCDTCHGSPPAPGRESYPGSAGAHAMHAGTLGFECATCHGNNGSGAQHNQGNGTVSRANVQIIFNSAITFPGGTTMRNGQANATYNTSTRTCAVGCHNPIINNPNEAPALSNTLTWTAAAPACLGCHDQVAITAPRSHNQTGLGDAGCLACHDQTGHTRGTSRFRDPDTSDAFAYAANNMDGLCKTCHDGAGGTAFGNKPAPNVSAFWSGASHGGEGYPCSRCHTYHSARTAGPLFYDAASTTCMQSGCHATLATTDFNQVPNGPVSHHRIQGGTGIALACVNCHNPHVDRPHPLAAIDPDNKYVSYNLPDTARTARKSAGNYTTYCLRCHDGSAPAGVTGAMNIAQALSGGTDPSAFRKEGQESLHRKAHSGYNCQNCHDPHASSGTSGINRGRLLFSWMTINNLTYAGENSCGTRPTGTSFSCH